MICLLASGLFSLPLTKSFKRVIAVEVKSRRRHRLRGQRRRNPERPGELEIREADSLEFLRRFREKPECIVLDPPRAGLSPEGAAKHRKNRPRRIVYVSCEPSTLARDLAAFLAEGYDIAAIDFFDVFPQTFHIETLVKLEKRA